MAAAIYLFLLGITLLLIARLFIAALDLIRRG